MSLPELVGQREIAQMAGVKDPVIANWRTRRNFPEPVAVIAAGSIWDKVVIAAWLEENCDKRTVYTLRAEEEPPNLATALRVLNDSQE